MKTCIVIPTYNEAKNIAPHIKKIFSVAKKAKLNLHILVVDDSSPDGTASIVRKVQKNNSKVHLLVRKSKEGLGAAYIHGMQHALKTVKPEIVMEMDADGQHNPVDLPRMIKAVKEGADFVIGSRYVQGGSIPDSWSKQQRIKSTCANFATRLLLGIRINDCSGGFRAIRATLLKKIPLKKLGVKGYAFQAVLLEAAIHYGAKVKEIPITFNDRELGESKMTFKDMLEPFPVFAGIRARRLFKRGAQA